MSKALLLSGLLFVASIAVHAQVATPLKKDSALASPVKNKVDTLKPKYVNPGKIAGRRAMIRSAILPGLGQIRSGFNLYRGLKVAGIYTGATLLTISYIDNNKNYHIFLTELQEREKARIYAAALAANNGNPNAPGLPEKGNPNVEDYGQVSDANLITAKDTYRRNKDVILFSYVGLYLLNVVDAYVDARLKYFDVGDVSVKIRPAMINNNSMYGGNTMYGLNLPSPGLKVAIVF
ncbi:DUF5683 domain-containing protein [Pedobacter gandavensis]|uniref:DUF5683 domain-containing protein n=1 Tax=Pedobacter gandavensis TaxID=2679963 RepID=A0ABR6F343_9SPHI|nr:DUF5683 domain-containing protein [Pedobacter gandavensis]MBB2151662.1 hypothetical protein [Pedobacter gandavensis]